MRTRFWLLACLILVGCLPEESESKKKEISGLQQYRLISAQSPEKIRTVRLDAHITVTPDLANISKQAKPDAFGNLISHTKLPDGTQVSIIQSGKGKGINIIAKAPKTGLTSAYDFDGDGFIDLMDVRDQNGARFALVDERAARLLSEWLNGNNPLCGDQALLGELGLSGFGCGNSDDGDSSPGSGGRPSGGEPSALDPFDSICAPYRNSAGNSGFFDAPVYAQDNGSGSIRNPGGSVTNRTDVIGGVRVVVQDAVATFPDGRISSTTRDIVYIDATDGSEGRIISIREVTDADGVGTRTVTDHRTGETQTTSIAVEVDERGNRTPATTDTAANDPDAPPEVRTPTDSEEGPIAGGDGAETRPGPDSGEDTAGLQRWCEITDPSRDTGGAAEEARESLDENLNSPICLDDGPPRQNCVTLEAATDSDVLNFAGQGGDGGCGPFARPGPDGTCGRAYWLDRIRGIGRMMAARSSIIEWCDPALCQPLPGP